MDSWRVDCGWVVCERLMWGRVMWGWLMSGRGRPGIGLREHNFRGLAGEPSTANGPINNIAVAVAVMRVISWLYWKLLLSINMHTKTSFVVLHVTYLCFPFRF